MGPAAGGTMTVGSASLTNRAMPNLSTGRRPVNIKCHNASVCQTLTWTHVTTVTQNDIHRSQHSLAKNFTKSRFRREMGSRNGRESRGKSAGQSSSVGQFAGAGFQFALMVILSMFAGIWIDRRLGTAPWLLIVTVFLGAALGFYSLYRNLMKGQRLGDRRQQGERREGEP